ncbi:hypothetical protein TCDM_09361 [Trypanosoma cruzi Dm28c]|uniref:Uncharacterized protein n=1 Tax=Trypanosoma cruzi Dm28c TaxID=1416333 RepID=V5BA56_TRYCR|nr:hypothetical protein TCDM_09361 [Trypanosoma cruzi Dm28c]
MYLCACVYVYLVCFPFLAAFVWVLLVAVFWLTKREYFEGDYRGLFEKRTGMSETQRQRGSTNRLLVLSICVLLFHVLTSLVQEAVFYIPGFHHTLLLTFSQALCVSCFAFVQLCRSLSVPSSSSPWRRIVDSRRVPLFTYFAISLMNTTSVYLTNEASRLLSFSTQVVFKSSKLLIVWLVRYVAIELPARLGMARKSLKCAEHGAKTYRRSSHTEALSAEKQCGHVSVKVLDSMVEGRVSTKESPLGSADIGGHINNCDVAVNFSAGNNSNETTVNGIVAMENTQIVKEVLSCIIVVVGLLIFTYATKETHKKKGSLKEEGWWPVISGVTGILLALLCDALIYLGEEKYCFMKHNASHEEVQFYIFLFSLINGFFSLALSGGFADAVEFVSMHHVFITLLLGCSFFSYSGTFFLLRIVSEYNSSTAAMVTSVRKMMTVLCSYIVYPKPFGFLHFVGVTFVMGGIWQYEEARRMRNKPAERNKADTVNKEDEVCV